MNRFIKIPSKNDGEYSIVIGFTNAYWRYYAAQVALSQAVLWMGRWGIWNSTGKQLFLSLLWHPIHQELLKMFLVQMVISHTTGAYWKSPNLCTKAPGYTSVHPLLLEMAGKSFWRTLLLEERKNVHFFSSVEMIVLLANMLLSIEEATCVKVHRDSSRVPEKAAMMQEWNIPLRFQQELMRKCWKVLP